MSSVTARPNESFESLLKRFKKAVERSGILADYRKHEAYEKPGAQKKRKEIAARKRDMKRRKKLERFQKGKNVSFRFNEDRTQKIYMTGKPKNKQNYNKQNKPYKQFKSHDRGNKS